MGWQDDPIVEVGSPQPRPTNPNQATLSAHNPSFFESVGNAIHDGANAIGLNGDDLRSKFTSTGVAAESVVDSVPIAGPLALQGIDTAIEAISPSDDRPIGERVESRGLGRDFRQSQNPNSTIAGALVSGAIGGRQAAALSKGAGVVGNVAKVLTGQKGLGKLALAGGAVGGADAAARGGNATEIATGATVGTLAPVAITGAIKGLGAGVKAAKNVGKIVRTSPAQSKAESEFAAAIEESGTRALTKSDIDDAIANQQPVAGIDLGGQATRSLAKTASNIAPVAQEDLSDFVRDRTVSTGQRLISKLNSINDIDDAAFNNAQKTLARNSNKEIYEKAYSENYGTSGPPVELDGLLKRVPASAIRDAEKLARAEGRPFGDQLIASIDDATGEVSFARMPSLRELDQIQRSLGDDASSAFRGGKGGLGGALKSTKTAILDIMDTANPTFASARANAKYFFDASDAGDAGLQFAKNGIRNGKRTLRISEAKDKFNAMSPDEQSAFRVNYLGEKVAMIEKIADGSGYQAISKLFKNQASRDQLELVVGKNAMNELEAFASIEDIMKRAENAVRGNSSTVQQLTALGLGAGAGATTLATDGDPTTALILGALVSGGKLGLGRARSRLDKNFAEELASILTETDPQKLKGFLDNAAKKPQVLEKIRKAHEIINGTIPFLVTRANEEQIAQ